MPQLILDERDYGFSAYGATFASKRLAERVVLDRLAGKSAKESRSYVMSVRLVQTTCTPRDRLTPSFGKLTSFDLPQFSRLVPGALVDD